MKPGCNALLRRHADDAEMNEEMRETERWNDPAAAFLTVRRTASPWSDPAY